MRKHIIGIAIIGALLLCAFAAGTAVNAYVDFVQANSLGAPSTGLSRLSVNASTKKMICTNSDSTSCLPSSGGGGGYSPFANFTALVNTSWSWINQGSSSVNFSGGLASIQNTGSGSDSQRLYVQALPATPWTVVAAIMGGLGINGTATSLGGYTTAIALTDGTKLLAYGIGQQNGGNGADVEANNYTNVTTFNSVVKTGTQIQSGNQPVFWLRISDDGTNWNFYYSADPTNIGWTLWTTEAHNTYLTPTSVGMAFNMYSGALNSITLNSNAFLSWAITSP